MMREFFYVLLGLLAVLGLVALGFQMRPRPLRMHPAPSRAAQRQPLRADLPAPVRRHFQETLGADPLTVESAVVWGRGRAYVHGVWAPVRFRAWYLPGQAFLRRIEVTWFGRPILRGREALLRGAGVFELGGRVEQGAAVDQSQTLALWAEAVWTPALLALPGAARWEAVDDHSACLIFPAGPDGQEDRLLAHFDPLSGRMTHLTGMRTSFETAEKEPLHVDLMEWKVFNGVLIPYHIAVAWGETGTPWVYWQLDGVAENVKVGDQLEG